MHKYRSYDPNKFNLLRFYHLTFKCDLDLQPTRANFQMALLLFKENNCAKLFWNPTKCFKWHYYSSRRTLLKLLLSKLVIQQAHKVKPVWMNLNLMLWRSINVDSKVIQGYVPASGIPCTESYRTPSPDSTTQTTPRAAAHKNRHEIVG